jgi:hypothetical protein
MDSYELNPYSVGTDVHVHGKDITADAVDDEPSLEPLTAAAPPERILILLPPPPVFRPDPDQLASPHESPPAIEPSQIRGGSEPTIVNGDPEPTPDEVSSPEVPLDVTEAPIPEVGDSPPANVRTRLPKAPIEMREKSTRIEVDVTPKLNRTLWEYGSTWGGHI